MKYVCRLFLFRPLFPRQSHFVRAARLAVSSFPFSSQIPVLVLPSAAHSTLIEEFQVGLQGVEVEKASRQDELGYLLAAFIR